MNASDPQAEARFFVDEYLAALLAQASHLISSEFHAVVRRHGFSVSEWRVLATLSGDEALSIGRVAQIVLIKQPTVTRLLDRMEAKGYVERLPHASDRRVTLVRMTAAGRRASAKLVALAREHEQRVLEPFGLQRAEQLKSTLRRIIDLHQTAVRD
ncbi:MAG: MarR family winged helix-turn-helix transcriptional regulator [Burkholderiaceae bacterium]